MHISTLFYNEYYYESMISRSKVREEMRVIDPDGFTMREPDAQKIHRGVLVSISKL